MGFVAGAFSIFHKMYIESYGFHYESLFMFLEIFW